MFEGHRKQKPRFYLPPTANHRFYLPPISNHRFYLPPISKTQVLFATDFKNTGFICHRFQKTQVLFATDFKKTQVLFATDIKLITGIHHRSTPIFPARPSPVGWLIAWAKWSVSDIMSADVHLFLTNTKRILEILCFQAPRAHAQQYFANFLQ